MIPLIMGVTGHRDIPDEDKPAIFAALMQEMEKLISICCGLPILVITGLAEGADQIAAHAVTELQHRYSAKAIEYAAVFPMQRDDYEKDFGTEESLTEFRKWCNGAKWIRELPYVTNAAEADKRDLQYRALGWFLAQHCQAVFAMWDGCDAEGSAGGSKHLPGGTSEVVHACRSGIPTATGNVTEKPMALALPEPVPVIHVMTRRKKRPDAIQRDAVGGVVTDYNTSRGAKEFNEVIEAFRDFNRRQQSTNAHDIAKSKTYLVGSTDDFFTNVADIEIETYCIADTVSNIAGTQRRMQIKIISALTILSLLCHQIYSGPDMRWHWLALHILLGLSAFFAFYFGFVNKKSRHEELHFDYRALAEGLRVQIIWKIAGIDASVADHYLGHQRGELNWIRQAIRNHMVEPAHQSKSAISESEALQFSKSHWLADQHTYFSGKPNKPGAAIKNYNKSRIFSRLSGASLGFGLILTCLLFVAAVMSASDDVLNTIIVVSGTSLIIAATLKTYAEKMAFFEQYNRYQKMGGIFEQAIHRFDEAVEDGDYKNARQILLAAGKEALAENSDWLILHRQRRFEMNI